MRETTMIFLNTWGLYNMSYEPKGEIGAQWGYVGYGWMTPQEAREFIESDPGRDGGEWFIADIDNYLGVKFSNLDYCDVMEIINTIELLEDMEDHELEEIIALMEYLNTDDIQEAIDNMDRYSFYSDIEQYHDCMDELIDFSGCNEILERYFDYEAYHYDCDFDCREMSNGVVIVH